MFQNGLYQIEVALTVYNNDKRETLNKERRKKERVYLGQVDRTTNQRLHFRWQQSAFFITACMNIVLRSNVSYNMSHGVPHEVAVRVLTVHSHARSQRVSLRGVSRALPSFRRRHQMRGVWGWRVLLRSAPRTWITLCLPDTSRPFVVWDAGTSRIWSGCVWGSAPLPCTWPPETKGHNALVAPLSLHLCLSLSL